MGNITDLIEEIRQPDHLKAWAEPDVETVTTRCKHIYNFGTGKRHLDPDFYSYRLSVYSIIFNLFNQAEAHQWLHNRVRELDGYDHDKYEDELVLARAVLPGPYTSDEMMLHSEMVCEACLTNEATSPITLKPWDFIETEATGFWELKYTVTGEIKSRKPSYPDLYKKWGFDHEHVTLSNNGMVYIYNGTHWEPKEELDIKGFVERTMDPGPSETHRKEFLSLIKANNLKPNSWLQESTEGFINLTNGVYNIGTEEMHPHSKKFGFRYLLPYSYDKDAKCPRFEKFLDEITVGRDDMKQVILEFMGYALANGACLAEKALILYGSGANGKSTFLDVLKGLAGSDNYSSLSLTALGNDTKRQLVDGKLFNIGEETNVRALGDSEVFKTMVTGGEIDVKKLYTQPYTIKNRCKLIMACNELPKSSDRSDGLYRRMLLVPFDAKFTDRNKDPEIREKLLAELPGIFNLAIAGYKKLKERRWRFSESVSLDEAMEEYKLENDNIRLWMHECLMWGDINEDYLFKHEMYDSYKRMCDEDGSFAVNKVAFFKHIKDTAPQYVQVRKYHPVLGKTRVVMGYKFKE